MKAHLRFIAYFLFFLLGLAAGGYVYSFIMNQKLDDLQEKMNVRRVLYNNAGGRPASVAPSPSTDFESAAAKAVNAVVYVSTRFSGKNGLTELFSLPEHGSGSGVVISKDGYIVTNHHVIDNANTITVTLNDKTEYEAELVAKDPDTDLALLKIKAESELETIPFGNSDHLRIGQWVLAIGNPFRLTSTVTAGIVSAKARNIGIIGNSSEASSFDYSIESFIQTDAAVNPGNSGGALIGLNGELIGINTAIATETGSYAGYSFAIPSNLVRKVVADLMEFGVVQRGFIGVSIQDIDARTAKKRGLSSLNGALVSGLSSNGAAAQAGIQEGDIITSVQDVPVRSSSELQEQIANFRPGDKINVHVKRGEKNQHFAIILRNINGEIGPVEKGIAPAEAKPTAEAPMSVLGATFSELTEMEAGERKIEFGLKVESMIKRSRLAEVGVPKGFIVTRVDKKTFSSFDEFLTLLENSGDVIYIEGFKPNGKKAYYVIRFDRD